MLEGHRKMQPLALRITTAQHVALQKLRDLTGMALQEHVRRAIDEYVARKEARIQAARTRRRAA
jgi:hypothetical protein